MRQDGFFFDITTVYYVSLHSFPYTYAPGSVYFTIMHSTYHGIHSEDNDAVIVVQINLQS